MSAEVLAPKAFGLDPLLYAERNGVEVDALTLTNAILYRVDLVKDLRRQLVQLRRQKDLKLAHTRSRRSAGAR